jgi:hypothetical protein
MLRFRFANFREPDLKSGFRFCPRTGPNRTAATLLPTHPSLENDERVSDSSSKDDYVLGLGYTANWRVRSISNPKYKTKSIKTLLVIFAP